jgi:hypothetical protein
VRLVPAASSSGDVVKMAPILKQSSLDGSTQKVRSSLMGERRHSLNRTGRSDKEFVVKRVHFNV